jgi:hypothetical protein
VEWGIGQPRSAADVGLFLVVAGWVCNSVLCVTTVREERSWFLFGNLPYESILIIV